MKVAGGGGRGFGRGMSSSKRFLWLGVPAEEKGCKMRPVNWMGMGHTGFQGCSEKLRILLGQWETTEKL